MSLNINVYSLTGPGSTQKIFSAPGYELVPGLGYYKLHAVGKTWEEALRTCEDEGAHLLVINSEYEANAMAPFWEKNPYFLATNNYYAYVGFHHLYREGQVVTIFSKYSVCYKNSG